MSGDDEDILDLSDEAARMLGGRSGQGATPPDRGQERPWISVHFECCNVYARVYRNAAGTAYVGWCPKCAAKVTVRVAPGGTTTRFFRAR
ncbi:MAG TPA: hypothetical protein PLP01_05585 [Phycisphaerae bacterium]|nr:hypothetical protein [Phycisphaerae bacterium]